MKLYVISIIAIFAALGIGIYVGFTLDTNSLIAEQREDIAAKIEEQFNFLKEENNAIKKELKEANKENNEYELFIDSIYEEIIKNRLKERKISIIETKNDYVYSGIDQILEKAGANMISQIIINEDVMDEKKLKTFYDSLQVSIPDDEIIFNTIKYLMEYLIAGNNADIIEKLMEDDFIDMIDNMDRPIDYVIIAGGSLKEDKNRINLIDETIIAMANDLNIPLIGVEKLAVNYSYMPYYKGLKISTIDNVDTLMGKISLVLAIEGRPGHYGVKSTAEDPFPDLKTSLSKKTKEQ